VAEVRNRIELLSEFSTQWSLFIPGLSRDTASASLKAFSETRVCVTKLLPHLKKILGIAVDN